MDYRLLHAELMGQMDTAHDQTHELEAVLVKTEEEREALEVGGRGGGGQAIR